MHLLKRVRMKATVLIIFMLLFILGFQLTLAQSSDIIYVNLSASGNADGTSWTDAFVDLQDALAAAEEGDEIWVAAGTYYPAVYEEVYVDRSATFNLKNGVALYGGFTGGEASLEDRDWENNVTVLSGDLDRNDPTTDPDGVVTDPENIVGDNAYHVVTASGTGAGTILDGFTITAGHADNLDSTQHGAGVHLSNGELVLANVTFSGNLAEEETGSVSHARGGGMYAENSTVDLINVIFSNNHAIRGGGLYQDSGQLIISNTIFNNNRAEKGGGGLFISGGQLTVSHTLISDNFSESLSGGLFNAAGRLILTNVDFENNTINGGSGAGLSTGIAQDVTLTDINFTGNKTPFDSQQNRGGGLQIRQGSGTLILTNATFSNNEAGLGGAIYLDGASSISDGKKVLSNVLISGNRALYGGGIHCNAGNLSLINVTLSGNWSSYYGGAIYNAGQTPTLTNCIIWGNDSQYYDLDLLYNAFDGNMLFQNSLLQGSGGSGGGWDEALGTDGGGNLDADPLFVEPAAASSAPTASGNYRIQEGSPAVDAGCNSPFEEGGDAFGVETDLDGNRRIIGGIVDMGAYELVYEEIDTGSLAVTIEPAEARGLGARWTIDGGTTWYESGTELDLDPGNYLLSFNKIDGLSEPFDADITINRGFSTSVTGIYRPEIIRVKHDAVGDGSGSSWEDAYTCLHQALSDSRVGMEIWVAEGIYTPPVPSNGDIRTATFQLTDGVGVYGGFGGTETSRDERDWETNLTVLSGDLDGDDTTDADGIVDDPVTDIEGDNAYTVVTAVDIGENTVIDGFIITAGKSDGELVDPFEQVFGGGMYIENASPALQNLIITGCYGGGIYNNESSPTLTDVVIKSNHGIGMRNDYSNPSLTRVLFEANAGVDQNSSGGGMLNLHSDPTLNQVDFISNGDWWSKSPGYGGGMANSNSNPTLVNVTFRGNYAHFEGGGMRNTNSSPTLVNALFSGNATSFRGGGMLNAGSSEPDLINVTFSSNYSAQFGGAIFNRSNANPNFVNSIIWQNMVEEIHNQQIGDNRAQPTFINSIIRGSGGSGGWNDSFGIDLGNNFDIDPLFINRPAFANTGHTGGDFRLQETSPAINAGSSYPFEPGGAAEDITGDLDGNSRIVGPGIDMGPYEYQAIMDSIAVVATASDLAAAVGNSSIETIRLANNITADINATRLVNIDFGSYTLEGNVEYDTAETGSIVFNGTGATNITGNLAVNTPNATVTNNARVGGTVYIKDVAGSTWVENADGNDLVIDLQDGTATIIINGSVDSLTVNGSGDELNIVINGSVATAVFNAPASITGAGSITSAYVAPEVDLELDEEPQGYLFKLLLQASPVEGGTVAGEGYYAEAEGVSISAQPKTGYRFVSWSFSRGTVDDTDAAETVFTMPARDVTVTANFAAVVSEGPSAGGGGGGVTPRYYLTLVVEGDGTVQPLPGKHTYRKDTVVNLEAAAAEGWVFEKWLGPVKDAESSATTVTVDQDLEVTAVFREVVMELEPTDIMLHIGTTKVLIHDEEEFQMDVAPFIEHDRTFVPVRFVAEIFGAAADWTPKEGLTEVVTLTKGDTFVTIKIGSPVITVREDGVTRTVTADVASQIVDDRTFLPLRAVGEIFGASFDWGPKEARTAWVSFTFFSKPE